MLVLTLLQPGIWGYWTILNTLISEVPHVETWLATAVSDGRGFKWGELSKGFKQGLGLAFYQALQSNIGGFVDNFV